MNDNEKTIGLQHKLSYFLGKNKLINIVRKSNPEIITTDEIIKYYDEDITNQLTKSQAQTKPTGHICAYHLHELWQMGIFDLSRYKLFNVLFSSRKVHIQQGCYYC